MELIVLAFLRSCDFALIAAGFALVFGSCRVLNLMHGSYVMLGAYLTHGFTSVLGSGSAGPGLVALAVLLSALATGLTGFGFFKLLQTTRRTRPEHVLAITVAGNLFTASLFRYVYGTEGVNVLPILPGSVGLGGVQVPASDLLVPVGAALAFASLSWWLYRTRSGTALRAVADNGEAALLLGVNSGQLLAVAVGISACMAGLAGALRAPSLTLSADMWVQPLLISFAVVVFGGRKNLAGALIAAGILGTAETCASWFWGESISQYVALVVIVAALYFAPAGLAGGPRHEIR